MFPHITAKNSLPAVILSNTQRHNRTQTNGLQPLILEKEFMNNNIWSPKGMGNRGACCKIPYKGYEISIAMDDSCGAFDTYSRSGIRIYREYDDKDVTEEFYKHNYGTCVANADNLKYIFCQN